MPQPERAIHPFNHPAAVFRALWSAWQQDAADERVDALAAELAARAAALRAPVCLGLLQQDVAPRLYGLGTFLDGCGVTLSQRCRQQGDGVFVFAEVARSHAVAPEFSGASVSERRVTWPLARAA